MLKKPLINLIVGEEISKNISGSFNQTLFNSIKQKVEMLKYNPQFGFHIPKNRIPKFYFKNFEINNLWKIDLPVGWRLIYSLRGSDVEILAIILDIFDHKDYEKKFGYRSSS